MSSWIKGVKRGPMTQEHKDKIRAANSGKNCYNYGKKMSDEGRKKLSERNIRMGIKPPIKRGKDHPFWLGGKTPLKQQIRNNVLSLKWRLDVFARDGFKCVNCLDSSGGNLQADHIKSFSSIINDFNICSMEEAVDCKELWDLNNGRTLCKTCHEKTPNYGPKWKNFGGRI